MARTKKVPSQKFTPEEIEIIHRKAGSIWSEVGYDVLMAVAEEGRDSVDRATVVEVVIDCRRLETEVRRVNPALADKILNTEYKQLVKIVSKEFPFSRYGM